jgi:hypothetical protein
MDVGAAMTDRPSERTLAYLVAHGCLPPGWSRAKLTRAFTEHGMPDVSLVLPSGVRYGAVTAQKGARAPAVLEHEKRKLVLIGESARRTFLYMDESGGVWDVGPPNLSRRRLAATDAWAHLERAVLEARTTQVRFWCACADASAEQLAEALGIRPIPEASDGVEVVRGDDHILLFARADTHNTLHLASLDDAAPVLRALSKTGCRVRVFAPHASIVHQAAGKTFKDEPKGVPLFAPEGIRGSVFAARGGVVQRSGRGSLTRELVVRASGAVETRCDRLSAAQLARIAGLSPRARKYLLSMGARRDPQSVCAERELEALVARWGLRNYPALLEANARWGGFAWGDEPPTQWGTCEELTLTFPSPPLPAKKSGDRRGVGLTWKGRELVIIGTTARTSMYLDHDGSVVEHASATDVIFPSATTILHRIEFEAALETVTGAEGQSLEGAVAGGVGAPLAKALRLTPLPEATDDIRAFWKGKHVSAYEYFSPVDGARTTAVFADSDEAFEAAMQRAERLAAADAAR